MIYENNYSHIHQMVTEESQTTTTSSLTWHEVRVNCITCKKEITLVTTHPEATQNKEHECMQCDIDKEEDDPYDPYRNRYGEELENDVKNSY